MSAAQRRGINRPLSPARKFVTDLVHFARQIPAVRVTRTMHIPDVVQARDQADPRPSWSAVFMKAYALVAASRPFLRQAFMRWPWEHLYEHPISICAVMIERDAFIPQPANVVESIENIFDDVQFIDRRTAAHRKHTERRGELSQNRPRVIDGDRVIDIRQIQEIAGEENHIGLK